MLHVIVAVGLVYVAIALFVMLAQRKLIYFPTRLAVRLVEHLAGQEGFRPWRNSNRETIGWCRPSQGTAEGTVLVLHGNAGCAVDRGYLAEPLHQAALDVYILEYPGYG